MMPAASAISLKASSSSCSSSMMSTMSGFSPSNKSSMMADASAITGSTGALSMMGVSGSCGAADTPPAAAAAALPVMTGASTSLPGGGGMMSGDDIDLSVLGQHARYVPSFVGQHWPVRPCATHCALAEQSDVAAPSGIAASATVWLAPMALAGSVMTGSTPSYNVSTAASVMAVAASSTSTFFSSSRTLLSLLSISCSCRSKRLRCRSELNWSSRASCLAINRRMLSPADISPSAGAKSASDKRRRLP
mmetsp:Transcript_15815/g.45551  ORF Transcript_15815/g.45551 Transcript_15815/m.45551 type:complete len:249 (+) Transcript_15815:3095-3841(+)